MNTLHNLFGLSAVIIINNICISPPNVSIQKRHMRISQLYLITMTVNVKEYNICNWHCNVEVCDYDNGACQPQGYKPYLFTNEIYDLHCKTKECNLDCKEYYLLSNEKCNAFDCLWITGTVLMNVRTVDLRLFESCYGSYCL